MASSASGVQADPACLESFQDMKLKKKYKYIIFKLNATATSIVVDQKAETASYEEFYKVLSESSPCWAVFDFDFVNSEGADRTKLVFYTWTPDTAKIKEKMLYASSKDALRKSLTGVNVEIQGTDKDEINYDTVLEKVNRLK
ncbi:cofilin [Mortierella sp. AM989]|nr:cofilin [Mortierella sp. AM989]